MSEVAKQRKVISHFKLRGLTLQKDASQLHFQTIGNVSDWEQFLQSIISALCGSHGENSYLHLYMSLTLVIDGVL